MNAERFEIHIGQLRLDPAWASRREDLAAALSHELARRLGAMSAETDVASDAATAACVAPLAAALLAQLAGRLGEAGVAMAAETTTPPRAEHR